jgi:hypothetical protein
MPIRGPNPTPIDRNSFSDQVRSLRHHARSEASTAANAIVTIFRCLFLAVFVPYEAMGDRHRGDLSNLGGLSKRPTDYTNFHRLKKLTDDLEDRKQEKKE